MTGRSFMFRKLDMLQAAAVHFLLLSCTSTECVSRETPGIKVFDSSGTASVQRRQLQQQSNALINETACSEEENFTFTSFVQVSGVTTISDGNSTSVETDLINAFVETYNDAHSSSCGEERGGVTIQGGRILDENDNKILLEIEATCLGCGMGEPLLFQNAEAISNPTNNRRLKGTSNKYKKRNNYLRVLQITTNSSAGNASDGEVPEIQPPCFCGPPLSRNFTDSLEAQLRLLQTSISTNTTLLHTVELEPVAQDCDTLPRSTFQAFVVVHLEQALGLTPAELAPILQDVAKETYNGINDSELGLCDPLGRRVEVAVASTIDPNVIYQLGGQDEIGWNLPTTESAAVLLELSVTCLGCDSTAFDTIHQNMVESRRRQLQAFPHECLCPVDDEAIAYRGPTLDEFREGLSALLPGLGFNEVLFDVQEMTSAPCPTSEDEEDEDALTDLSEIVLVDFVLDCSLVDADGAFLANQFVEVYNTLSQNNYCDPYVRRLTSAEVLRRGETISTDGVLTVELQLNGTCIGCDPSVDGFYFVPVEILLDDNAISINEAIGTEINDIDVNSTQANGTDANSTTLGDEGNQRHLGDESKQPKLHRSTQEGVCYCPTEAVGARAPSEAEVMDEFRNFVQQASQDGSLLRCVTSVGQCQFGTTFESSFLVAFSELNATLEAASDLEVLMQDTLNSLFANRIGVCRPDFRMVQSVRATIGVDLAGEDLRRHLENLERRTR